MHILFVYGTLKSQQDRNFLLDDAEYISEFSISDYSLFTIDGVLFPFMVSKSGGSVFGEIYRVSDDLILELDQIEGHPDFYVRSNVGNYRTTLIESYVISMDRLLEFYSNRSIEEIPSGIWQK
jgi:gamma-glutamylaminecyclotransferase